MAPIIEDADRVAAVEHSIAKKYRKSLWRPFVAGIKKYELISPGDRVAVCMSGGKDSALMAKLFQMLLRHSEFPFEAVYMIMDPGYSAENRARVLANAERLGIPADIFQSDIFDVAARSSGSPCYLCARMRRGHLYKAARERGCNKIALGHHFNDVVETILMGMLHGAQIQTMMPKLHSKNFQGMELIRPMYHVREDDIVSWARHIGVEFIRCACRFTENCSQCEGEGGGARAGVKRLIADLKREHPDVERHIFSSVNAVNLDVVLGYKQNGVEHSFLDSYALRESGRA
ncbi:MAG: tRNA 2-thiocytidine biosynthesis protein TtcA [Oscillospiraceae bacterium]|jgi:tRNA(Ile)-lysidine synthase TilS/MesJ|nr:tRNA 2-thiocytidine biosynthesis protein TtcA [Oscillospiraceae bacterium]